MKAQNTGESEEERFKQKCKELQKRIKEVEESNEIATIAYSRTQSTIRRLRLEYAILIERLEDRANYLPDGIIHFEEMAGPPTPNILDDSIVKNSKNGTSGQINNSINSGTSNSNKKSNKKSSKSSSSSSTNQSTNSNNQNSKNRDPDLPKRPTNAYLLFCEQEKERLKNDESNNTKDLSKLMTEAWKNLSEEDRRPFYLSYEDDKLRYQKEMVEYNHKKELEEQQQQLKEQQGEDDDHQADITENLDTIDNVKEEEEEEEEDDDDNEERVLKRQKLEPSEEFAPDTSIENTEVIKQEESKILDQNEHNDQTMNEE
ncbi:NHP10 [Candida jiufengensis]|uniref:NHP10 n=1 Tax=Candida jiufengensis TaxID=497108 RepID=UPI0022249116|nr:NHP10 [Candida jiufengensis]KAI5953251.1 NHP10 [Candida jiufengensis]